MYWRDSSGLGQSQFPVALVPAAPLSLTSELVWVGLGLAGLLWITGRMFPRAAAGRSRTRTTRRTASRSTSNTAIVRDVTSVLRNQGLRASDSKRVAKRAAAEGGSFDAVVRRAIRMAG